MSQAAGEACRRISIGLAQGLAIADALKDQPINHAALTTWAATAPPKGLRAMVRRWERQRDKAGSRLATADPASPTTRRRSPALPVPAKAGATAMPVPAVTSDLRLSDVGRPELSIVSSFCFASRRESPLSSVRARFYASAKSCKLAGHRFGLFHRHHVRAGIDGAELAIAISLGGPLHIFGVRREILLPR